MKRPQDIAVEEATMGTIVNLTSAFEGLASMRIASIKDQVQQSEQFFGELWQIYQQIRIDPTFRFGRENDHAPIDKELIIAITAEGGFSGDIDQKLIRWMIEQYDADKHDIIIIGHHGAVQLTEAGVAFKKYFKLPARDVSINVTPLMHEVQQYRDTTVFYQTYVSLMVQDIKKIKLQTAVQEAGRQVAKDKDIISEKTYIFEPSTIAVIGHLERVMVGIALSQTILESKLAQYASRFRAMSVARERAEDSKSELHLLFNRTRRATADERLKEITNGLRHAGAVQ
ncbi:MAG TPA: F0F1 ATP synthase subunit gamma [Candidatus Saccharimonadales bacterium]|nr:F0F1 ATP synthase subunit gamma [Candidatus Saccharimonadales bacterium]